ncbi:hypothetical protein [Spirosoma endophyticum]|uniref:Uncharacterized protein n=1 Tax=Spirosoma endophyticum TaxID=662367 RepID=A0A1I1SLZ6_9BACT|nr:hypothetical protein [Spirosoma endophyticum]SFD47515.1 hypothetical protein SAMN05216167_105157 [Spirosoma endophyticum]
MTNNRFVQLFTWWTNPTGTRQFCVVEKFGKFTYQERAGGKVELWETTQVKLIEVLNPNPINWDTDKFWDLVDRGKLIEYIPGVTTFTDAKNESIPWRNPENEFLTV